MKKLIFILVLFSGSVFSQQWNTLTGVTMRDILKQGYELKEVTVDPSKGKYSYSKFYHFVSYEYKVIVICSVDIYSGVPNDTICYSSPQ